MKKMQTIKNGRKRGCGSCGQSESYESLQLTQPVIHGAFHGLYGTIIPVHNTTWGDIQQVRVMAELPLDKKLAA
jgi:hypothetical protein